ncbi:peptidoglycan DD-metalloendopeptidase family protein [Ideonella sp. 4Y16]|uniref:Peptidoglycan DD-metalloendopeptidase family protein n=2 Tax=Ideonella alba TaxID=2824118 RepID=A0A941BGA6_9BURK|nr:peptidoglycan DD-metalloendopeptidase family protein [Ideonella alba]MBQ0932881.1 peptidoglycan DD-metalloendopeptidase family protein [Ideonella alba]MBQ0942712.1 peptidoglycan DD-metalloendopeptidase family protein [Ideonella alba]
MTDALRPLLRRTLMIGLATLLVACSATRPPAPVEDRSAGRGARPVAEAPKPAAPASAPAAAPADLKPGTYVVKPGDTLMRIALENGQGWRDIARWNGIENPNLIEVGQVLRVAPPEGTAVATKPVTAPKVDAKPLPGAASASASGAASAPAATPAPAPAPLPKEADDDIPWGWPAAGPVISPFDEARSKGLGIGGRAGDPVLAAADGRVVYAGSGLRGYGNLVIVKHNATYLTAYAHNQTLLVKEDQAVRKGQKIAEMGNTDAERVQLHFEIRRQGKPIDPARLLPAR